MNMEMDSNKRIISKSLYTYKAEYHSYRDINEWSLNLTNYADNIYHCTHKMADKFTYKISILHFLKYKI